MEEKKFSIKSVMKKTAIVFSLVLVVGVIYSLTRVSLPEGVPKGSKEVVITDRIKSGGLYVGNTHVITKEDTTAKMIAERYNKELAEDIENNAKEDREHTVDLIFIGDPADKDNSVNFVPIETIKEYVVIEIKNEDGKITHYSIDAIGHDGKAITTGWDIPENN